MGSQANSHKTALRRRGASAPCLWLASRSLIQGDTLDWGCGHGADIAHLRKFHRGGYISGYDPHHHPIDLPNIVARFDTILCTYVLNTLPNYFDRALVIEQALAYLRENGTIFIAIRSDKARIDGYRKNGTWQGYVSNQLKTGGLTLVGGASNQFEIWSWKKPPR